jgi:hypothetical protein
MAGVKFEGPDPRNVTGIEFSEIQTDRLRRKHAEAEARELEQEAPRTRTAPAIKHVDYSNGGVAPETMRNL